MPISRGLFPKINGFSTSLLFFRFIIFPFHMSFPVFHDLKNLFQLDTGDVLSDQIVIQSLKSLLNFVKSSLEIPPFYYCRQYFHFIRIIAIFMLEVNFYYIAYATTNNTTGTKKETIQNV